MFVIFCYLQLSAEPFTAVRNVRLSQSHTHTHTHTFLTITCSSAYPSSASFVRSLVSPPPSTGRLPSQAMNWNVARRREGDEMQFKGHVPLHSQLCPTGVSSVVGIRHNTSFCLTETSVRRIGISFPNVLLDNVLTYA